MRAIPAFQGGHFTVPGQIAFDDVTHERFKGAPSCLPRDPTALPHERHRSEWISELRRATRWKYGRLT